MNDRLVYSKFQYIFTVSLSLIKKFMATSNVQITSLDSHI